MIEVRTFTAPGFGQNAYVVWRRDQNRAIVIDPGGEAAAMASFLDSEGLELEAILLTHAHVDHVEGVAELVARTGAPVYLHPADRALYGRAAEQALFFGMRIQPPPPADRELVHGETLELGGLRIEVRHSPGHASGHVIFHVPDAGVAFVGDVVFQGSIGRTDLPGGDFEELMRSIREQVLTLPDDTVLYPGHGPETTVAHERVSNPFLIPIYRGGFA